MYFKHPLFNLYYAKYGDQNKTLIILPGWGDTRKTFSYLIDNLKDNYTVYIFDYPGFGKTHFPQTNLTIYDYVKVFYDFLNDKKIINPTIIGHSFGGRMIILLSSIYQVHFEKIILMDSAGIKNFSIKKLIKKYLYKFLKKLKFLFKDKQKYLNKLLSIFGSTDFKNIDINMQKTFINIVNTNLKDKIKNIHDETIIIWGKNDLETPFKDAIYFNKTIQNSYLFPIEKSGHFPYLDYPQLVLNIIIAFLEY